MRTMGMGDLTWIVQLVKEDSSPRGLGICLIRPPAARYQCLRAGYTAYCFST